MTRAWLRTRVTALAGLATMWATTGSWDTEESVMAITIVSAALVALLGPQSGSDRASAFDSDRAT